MISENSTQCCCLEGENVAMYKILMFRGFFAKALHLETFLSEALA